LLRVYFIKRVRRSLFSVFIKFGYDLDSLENNLGVYVGSEFGIWSGNWELLEFCRMLADDPYLHPDFALMEIIYELWEKLQETHRLRAVK